MPFVYSVRGIHNTPKTARDSLYQNANFKVTGGDKVFTAGGYVIHMFTSVGDAKLTVDSITSGNSKYTNLLENALKGVEYLIIGGGAAGGSRHGGGGGAGGMIVGSTALSATSFPITVGAGGTAQTGDTVGNSGQNSTFAGATALGGGGGGTWGAGDSGNTGGSGGGGSGGNGVAGRAATQPASPGLVNSIGYGNRGGNCFYIEPQLGAGGGGGSGGAGSNGSAPIGGRGGDGRANSILGTAYFWAAGGGGGSWRNAGGQGGTGGGGAGIGNVSGAPGQSALNNGGTGTNGPGSGEATGTTAGSAGANTGSGGGGALQTPSTSGAGGSGIVVIRYPR